MYPILFKIGPLTVHTYGLMVATGILAGVALAEFLFRREGGEPGKIIDLALIAVIGGIIGARALFIVVNLDYFLNNPLEILMIWRGGLVFYGGMTGGALGLIAAVYFNRMQLLRTLDVSAAGLTMGHALGRIGCFSAGCCYGKPTDLPWAVIFTDPLSLATGVLHTPVHPTQLYSFSGLLLLTIYLVWLHSRKRFHGQLMTTYLIIYSLFRFSVEFLRGDPRGSMDILGITLSTSQIVSLVILPVGVVLYFFFSRKPIPDTDQNQLQA